MRTLVTEAAGRNFDAYQFECATGFEAANAVDAVTFDVVDEGEIIAHVAKCELTLTTECPYDLEYVKTALNNYWTNLIIAIG